MLCLADSEIPPAEMGTIYHFYKNINGFQPVFSINPKSGVNSGTEFGTRRGVWISSLEGILSAG
jgi:hypothetical protein